jgi:uncharacterized protein (DUF2336 family)
MSMMAHSDLIAELEVAFARGGAERSVDWLQRITDLFALGAERFSDDHVSIFDDVMCRLAAEIEVSARAALSERLAGMPSAPPRIIRSLAFDDMIDVAGPVLTSSERLDEACLVENAMTKGQQHLLAISQRKSLGPLVTNVLVERGDRAVVQSAAANRGAKFSDFGYASLVRQAEGDDQLAETVGSRPEIPRHHFLKLLAKASHVVRRKLEAADPRAVGDIRRVVSEVTWLIQARSRAGSRDYAAARTLVETLRASGRLGQSEIEGFAAAGKFEETTVALAALCDLPIETVESAMVQERSELVMVLARAVGLSWRATKLVLLMRAGTHGLSTHELEQQLKGFELLRPATARQIVRFQRMRAQGTASRQA